MRDVQAWTGPASTKQGLFSKLLHGFLSSPNFYVLYLPSFTFNTIFPLHGPCSNQFLCGSCWLQDPAGQDFSPSRRALSMLVWGCVLRHFREIVSRCIHICEVVREGSRVQAETESRWRWDLRRHCRRWTALDAFAGLDVFVMPLSMGSL